MTTIATTTATVRSPWPSPLTPVFARFLTTEFATLTRAGAPITWPVTPYVGAGTIDVTAGLAYPSKAERARHDPRVALLFSWPAGSGLRQPDTVLVQGLATVRDADLQSNVDRYLEVAFDKVPDAYAGVPPIVLERLMDWYWPRVWVHVTPVRIAWWPAGDLSRTPLTWSAPAGTSAPASDPAPRGESAGVWTAPIPDVAARLGGALELGAPVLTTTDAHGWPLPLRTRAVRRVGATRLEVQLPAGTTVEVGPVCVTFHDHPERFDRQRNAVLVGTAEPTAQPGVVVVSVDRALGDFSLPGSPVARARGLLRTRRVLRPRVRLEAARRGQPIPVVRIPRR